MQPFNIDQLTWFEETGEMKASGTIPADAEYFRDHFPDFPVFPGVLALEILKRMAEEYGRLKGLSLSSRSRITALEHVRFTRFFRPGDKWEGVLSLVKESPDCGEWKGWLLKDSERAVAAKFSLTY